MAKRKPAHVEDLSSESTWPLSRRLVVSVLLWVHLIAVFAAPWSDPPPSSELARRVASCFRPYLKFASLDNGYRFFAPDPGPSHLIRYEITTKDGEIVKGQLPKRGQHWPRLLYHRHFMISEMIFTLTAPTLDVPPMQVLSEQDRQALQDQRALSGELQRSIARYLFRQQAEAQRIRLFTVIHGMPSPSDVMRGMQLDDPMLYQDVLLGEFTESEL